MEFDSKTRLLIVAAHPDDEVLGCGGTIVKAIEKGAHVGVLFLGEGVSARFPIGQYDSKEFKDQTAQRQKRIRRSDQNIGCSRGQVWNTIVHTI